MIGTEQAQGGIGVPGLGPAGTIENGPCPEPEYLSPYSADFLAHLHGGAYDTRADLAQLWREVRADSDAVQVLTAFAEAMDWLRLLTGNVYFSADGLMGAGDHQPDGEGAG